MKSTDVMAEALWASGPEALDEESRRGRFGWAEIDEIIIPYIFRGTEMFTSARIFERKIICKYLNVLTKEVNSCHQMLSYYITVSEAKLFNEINKIHCDLYFGKETFTTNDLVIRMTDAQGLCR